ncbi:hypothetical protein F1D05_10315 [Kribbella qitaiheensis]|uniref:Uncharacterized protein n=1 Tax=Kribbella qitaiheensis TaxID=1544730 RepID=A0A7G6WW53_9ACTN|nr:DUF6624 domain-containing protein [Kribbella qitaiheensis]QNE18218.1 hypothetical protein F1D05_10315 [Kribbella qitaiheensis]
MDGWSDDPRTELWKAISEVDADNTGWLVDVVTERGWPKLSEVGEEAATAAWLLAQHADMQPDNQRFFHQLMEQAVDAGEASPRFFAYLEDRVRVNSNRPQLFGTQFVDHGNGLAPRPIEDLDGLAVRRAAVGMEPFEEYEATMHEIWQRDGASADPPDGD